MEVEVAALFREVKTTASFFHVACERKKKKVEGVARDHTEESLWKLVQNI